MLSGIGVIITRGIQGVKGADPRYFLIALATYYISVFLFSVRWKYILRGVGMEVPLGELFQANLAGLFMNNITPMSRGGGEFLRMMWISKRSNVPMGISAVTVLYERILESIPVMFMTTIGMFYFTSTQTLLALLLGVVVAFIWLKWDRFIDITLRLFRVKVSEEDRSRIVALRNAHSINLIGITMSSAVWVLDVARLKLITLAFGLHIPLVVIVFISVVNLILGIAAFTPGGVGVVEGGLVGALTYVGLSPAIAVSVVVLERFISYVLGSVPGIVVLLTSGGREVWRALKSH